MSPCGRYRYLLRRQLCPAGTRVCLFVMLNPSTADATMDDPTIRRCAGFARAWGFDWLHVVNLFAWRATDPLALRTARDPVGPENDVHLQAEVVRADRVVFAWGRHGGYLGRGQAVREALAFRQVHVLGQNADGSPKHPLCMPAASLPTVLQG
ncbi:DUF1643 domain-containing protein [Rhodanobacter sp. FW106-PBR-LB-1-21]